MNEMDEFLKEPEPEITPDKVEAVAEEPEIKADPEARPEDAKPEGEAEPTDKKDDGSMSEPEKTVPIASYMAEKQKRQEYEARLAELEKQAEQKADFYEDPEGFIKAEMQKLETKSINDKVNMSVEIAKTVYPDFDDVMNGTWEKLIEDNPYLLNQAFESSNPGLFAYQQCKNHKTLQEIGDPTTFKERLKAELLKEIEEGSARDKARENIPESLAAEPNAKGRTMTWAGPEPLDEIVG